jgi:hypothetical protein
MTCQTPVQPKGHREIQEIRWILLELIHSGLGSKWLSSVWSAEKPRWWQKFRWSRRWWMGVAEVAETRVKILLCCGPQRTGKAMGQVYKCRWRIYREIHVFFSKLELEYIRQSCIWRLGIACSKTSHYFFTHLVLSLKSTWEDKMYPTSKSPYKNLIIFYPWLFHTVVTCPGIRD